ncbi:MAG: hypothetical protein VX776_02740, partial [Planctomycetota bacterium]|nr:hypothetical protein [Planctomycetota bacterium]
DTLLPPPKQPDYRQSRTHMEFVTNLKRPIAEVQAAIIEYWKPNEREANIPARAEVLFEELMDNKYQNSDWNILS